MYLNLDLLYNIFDYYQKYIIYLYENSGWFAWYYKCNEKIVIANVWNSFNNVLDLKNQYINEFNLSTGNYYLDNNNVPKRYRFDYEQDNLKKYFRFSPIKFRLYKISNINSVIKDTLYETSYLLKPQCKYTEEKIKFINTLANSINLFFQACQ